MGRIVFLNCFPKDQFSGGIKTTYHHAVCLKAQGFDVHVLQPEGPPVRLKDTRAQELVCQDVALDRGDVAVFPETLSGWFGEVIRAPLPAKKVIFCQNPYYFFWYCHSKEELEQWGVERIIVPSQWAKRTVQSVLGVEDVEVVQPSIDPELFVARDKEPRIVSAGWKWDGENHLPPYDRLIRKMLRRKYPALTSVPWSALGEVSEQVVADTMGQATVCLSLGRLEALGMTALEAMAAECCVVGFHGSGGEDYATAQNGFWHSPEDLEGVVDSLALALEMTENGGIVWQKMRQHGVATARRYHPDVTEKSLYKVYSALFS
ncbi:glycosyltransferase family 4 protein [Saccharibacter floricola]|uniref:Glycoside hydrolase family protein n=1 Tax=Saccharibacter floricola DSM 15669 TaxID=1123227 RepID=A0ABQ0NYU0_9PROT|nr:glycosyltransferase family 4 protein [Saccharibacter floricola]GBQ06508.1 glycoside hydrolase family protein [Saccharibacter floricola DSM 15669]